MQEKIPKKLHSRVRSGLGKEHSEYLCELCHQKKFKTLYKNVWKSHCHSPKGIWHSGSSLLDADFSFFFFFFFFFYLAISFAMLKVLCCAKKVSLHSKASQQPAKTGIKKGKHCCIFPNLGEDEAKANNLRELSSEVNFSFSSWVISTLSANYRHYNLLGQPVEIKWKCISTLIPGNLISFTNF